MPALYIQERANKGVCKPKADSEVRAIPPDGLHEFSLGQGCLEREKLAGEQCSPLQFSFSKKGTGRCGHRPLQIPLSATLTSQHKAHPSGAFSRGTEYSSALSGISSMRGDFHLAPPLGEPILTLAKSPPQHKAHSAVEVKRVTGEQYSPLRYAFSRTAKGYAFSLHIPHPKCFT